MKLKNVEFVLENCDRIIVDGKYMGDFIVEDIETSIEELDVMQLSRWI